MHESALVPIAITIVALGLFLAMPKYWRQLLQDLQEVLNNWRGGPPTGPLPANDSVIVLRRRRKAAG